jgi:hypothetical protein
MSAQMNVAVVQVREKWMNISLLIIAKNEHKEKFYNRIDYGDDGIMVRDAGLRSIPYHIDQIKRRWERFIYRLEGKMEMRFEEYLEHRKTMAMPDYHDTAEYNCETDCPVCYEPFDVYVGIDHGCHDLCVPCHDRIVLISNRCPICREVLDSFVEQQRQREEDEDDEDDEDNESEDDVWRGNWVRNDEGVEEWIPEV